MDPLASYLSWSLISLAGYDGDDGEGLQPGGETRSISYSIYPLLHGGPPQPDNAEAMSGGFWQEVVENAVHS
ncbi:hypothetical protein KL86CLO1_10052 [uncultured Eubacteriales bacterium]|uniref:Uncharacterized protein n=1 Tax=uncultured Eubacteriales bacterium TaxID=172733 RepID=A0A212IVJ9_9FIRM|nr:hypothetical protein KL86CLO1_10052 [uncultured Eubacteriales bacterium]